MMTRLLLFMPLLCLLLSAPGHAAPETHARSAFQFADKRDWNNALIHARRANDEGLLRLIEWQYLMDSDSGAGFHEIMRFLSENPKWPEHRRLRIRAELALKDSGATDNDLVAWFGGDIPITGAGKIALAEALERQQLANRKDIEQLVRDAWIQGDFDKDEVSRLLARYGNILTREDHAARIDRLLWEEKIAAAEDLFSRVDADRRKLYNARIALTRGKKNAAQLLAQVPSSLQNDAGLLYDRMRYRHARDDHKGARDILLRAPDPLPYAEKWWRYREMHAREAIDEGDYKTAQKLVETHGLSDGSQHVEALWLQGWLYLEFLRQPQAAYNTFYRMYDLVKFPVSRARAAYWAARAAERAGNRSAAESWYTTASAYPTAFYGQMAALKVHGTAPLRLPAEPRISSSEQHAFDKGIVARAAVLAARYGNASLASRLIYGMIENAQSKEEAAMIAALGREVGQPYLSVRGAKRAQQHHNITLLKSGYPTPKTPYDAAVERPLVLAITRQESEFDPRARSPAGAMGMMQLLASTARETARKAGLKYSASRLWEPSYNWTLGSHYLNRMIDSYGGSYVMAIAAYNAGPGNVRKWARQFGTPGNDIDGAIMWMERIPFAETRNYVHRVLENLQLYRHILAEGEAPKLRLGEDLKR